MKSLKIEIPKGYQVDTFDAESGKLTFKAKPLNIRERINSLDDVFELNGTTQAAFDIGYRNHPKHEKAHALELLIVAAYNEGKKPDWRDGTRKVYPLFNMPDSSGVGFSFNHCDHWHSHSLAGARQVFLGPECEENCADAVEKFLSQYKDSRTL